MNPTSLRGTFWTRATQLLLGIAALLAIAATGFSQTTNIIEDDTWADGTITNENLPAESAWFSSPSAGSLAVATNAMTGTVGGGSTTWITYFTTNPVAPIQLAVGQTLTATFNFVPTGVIANTSQGLRLGLFNYANGGTRETNNFSSSKANGTNVLGYMVNVNFSTVFGQAPFQSQVRSNLADGDLMGTKGDFVSLGAGGGTTNDPGFLTGSNYVFEFSVTRNASSMSVVTTASGPNLTNSSITLSKNDTNNTAPFYCTAFDTFAIRPNSAATSATNFTFSEFKLALITPAAVNTNAVNITALVTNSSLVLSWPADHTGWRLLSQTNSPGSGLTTNWTTVPGSTNVNQITMPIESAGSAFFRLAYP